MIINLGRIDFDYCRDCIWLYRRGDFRSKEYRSRYLRKLRDKGCRYNFMYVLQTVKRLEKRGVLRTKKKKLQDPKSTYGFDYFRIVYLENESRKSILDLQDHRMLNLLKIFQ